MFYVNRLTELFLERRGIDLSTLRDLDLPHDGVLQDIDLACDRLALAKMSGRKVVILPDFDMDGISAGVCGYAGLAEMGFDVELFEPNPVEGYGFTAEVIDRLVAEHPGVGLILTCDVGVSCKAGVKRAVDLGIEVVVTDHHKEAADTSPKELCSAFVDPCRIGEEYPNKSICGAFVLWKVLDRYARRYGSSHDIDQVARLRVFAGLGTVSDMMPLRYENRLVVRDALSVMKMIWSSSAESSWFLDSLSGCDIYCRVFAGIKHICDAWLDAGKISKADDIDEAFIGYYVAPAFNSCKRMSEPMAVAFGVFIAGNQRECMDRLIYLNEQRKALVEQKLYDVLNVGETELSPYIHISDAPAGIVGLLAARLMDDSGLPCLVVTPDGEGGYGGSGRSPSWYPFLARTEGVREYAAGHEGAFGVSFTGYSGMERLVDFLRTDVAVAWGEVDHSAIGPGYDVDVAIDGTGDCWLDVPLIAEFLTDLEQFRPFGVSFREPVVRLRFATSDGEWVPLKEGRHCKIRLPYGVNVLVWNRPDIFEQGVPEATDVGLLGHFEFNDFAGMRSLQFVADSIEFGGETNAA